MKNLALLVVIVLSCLSLASVVEGQAFKIDAPKKWRTESVALPPRFAPKVSLKGKAKVYFSPGWGKKNSEQFFTYAFLFQTQARPKFDEKVIEKEILAYLGGLAKAVSRGKVDPDTFKMSVTRVAVDSESKQAETTSASGERFNAVLEWTEPFFTKAAHTLNMEIIARFNATDKKNYLMVCVSPQDPKGTTESSSKIWQQLREMQASFIKDETKVKVETNSK